MLMTALLLVMGVSFSNNALASSVLDTETPAWQSIDPAGIKDDNFEVLGQRVLLEIAAIVRDDQAIGSCKVEVVDLATRYVGDSKDLPIQPHRIYDDLQYAAVIRVENASGASRDFVLRSTSIAGYSLPFFFDSEESFHLVVKPQDNGGVSGMFRAAFDVNTGRATRLSAPGFDCRF